MEGYERLSKAMISYTPVTDRAYRTLPARRQFEPSPNASSKANREVSVINSPPPDIAFEETTKPDKAYEDMLETGKGLWVVRLHQ